MRKINAIAFAAISGTGKATVSKHLMEVEKGRFEVVGSITTRPPKKEVHGKEYEHVTHKEFEEMIDNGYVLEHNKYSAKNDQGFNYYGSSRRSYERIIAAGKIAVFDIELNGIVQVKPKLGQALLALFLQCEIEEIRRRLTNRGAETPEEIEERLRTGKIELEMLPSLEMDQIIDRVIWYGAGEDPEKTARKIHLIWF